MIILINLSTVNGGGATQVATAVLEDLKVSNSNDFVVVLSPSLYGFIETNKYPPNFKFYWLKKHISSSVINFLKTIKELKNIERINNVDFVFTVFGPSYWTPKKTHLMGYAIPHYVYSESPFFNKLSLKELFLFNMKKYLQFFYIKNNSKYYHVETEDVKRRLSASFNIPLNNIFVVSASIHPCYFESDLRQDIKIESSGKFDAKLISISSTAKHKNLLIINEVLPILKNEYGLNVQFILTLPSVFFSNNFDINDKNIINIGPVRIENCPSLYEQSDFVFSPSLLECFSAVYPEAMFMQKPLLVSDLPFSNEVCKEAALYFSPLSPKDLAEKINQLIKSMNNQSDLIEAGNKRFKDFPTSNQRTNLFLKIIREVHNEI
jgi:glycosyltransferase involved in cell wall biosynthesis